ncbi:MAG: F0F1 ATP synthase subunit A [Tidjanibacter sp.]|nr:F0F1 ATP synthase subunit A [Tidjanibacter sp.]
MKTTVRHIVMLVAVLLVGALWSGVWAQSVTPAEVQQPPVEAAEEVEEVEEKLDVVGLIMDHINDSYSWHIATVNGHHIEIPLLCIVRAESGRWSLFSSSKVSHGHSYEGFYVAPKGAEWEGKLVAVGEDGQVYRPIDLSLTKNAAGLIINSLLLVAVILGVAGWYRRRGCDYREVPRGFVGAVEMLVMSLEDDIIRPSVGKDYKRYSPYLLTAFFFIFFNNLMGLVPTFPGGANTTGNIAVTLVMALATMFAVNVFGNKEYWKEILWPDVPVWMKFPIPLMPVIELFGVISKPFALTVRLFANILAGHTVILALTCLVFISVSMGTTMNVVMTVFSVLLSVFMLVLEVLVAYIQAYVFTMLSSVFIGLSRKEHHAAHKKAK